MNKIVLEDHHPQRGFLSGLNLTLLSILYLRKKNIHGLVGKSILSNYAHAIDNYVCKSRPFSSFFGDFRQPGNYLNLSKEYIDEQWLSIIKELDWQGSSVISQLSTINAELLESCPTRVTKYINQTPKSWPNQYDIALHYRGCDYLANTPSHHKPNFSKEIFFEKCLPYLKTNKTIFVATDDNSFVNFLENKDINFYTFKDVIRGSPGKGVHAINRFQKIGLELPHKPFLRGTQVLRDCVHLSRADQYVGSNSNLMYYANVLNPGILLTNLSVNSS